MKNNNDLTLDSGKEVRTIESGKLRSKYNLAFSLENTYNELYKPYYATFEALIGSFFYSTVPSEHHSSTSLFKIF